MNLKHQLLSQTPTKVEVPECGSASVYLRRLTFGERLELFERLDTTDAHNLLLVLNYCLADESGNRLFANDELPEMSALPVSVVLRLGGLAVEQNSLRADSVDEAKKL